MIFGINPTSNILGHTPMNVPFINDNPVFVQLDRITENRKDGFKKRWLCKDRSEIEVFW